MAHQHFNIGGFALIDALIASMLLLLIAQCLHQSAQSISHWEIPYQTHLTEQITQYHEHIHQAILKDIHAH